MIKLRIDWKSCPATLTKGLREIITHRPAAFSSVKSARAIHFLHDPTPARPTFTLTHDAATSTIRYSRPCDAFRALGQLLGQAAADNFHNITQSCQFDFLGIKLDASRNGVPTLETLFAFLRMTALMGFNGFCLYMEDTYEIKGEPFFGYLRGAYSQKDLKDFDDYAHNLGIEAFGHTQTLGHVEQILHWPAYADLKDVTAVFLADHEPTYKLLEKMITTIAAPFRSKRIFPGVDEAHGLGTGRYRRLIGFKPSFDIFHSHLNRLSEICKRLGLRPASSADMYFRLGSKDNWYYDEDAVIPPEVLRDVPKDIQLVYWDYYHTDQAFYERWIDKHRAISNDIMVLGGIWTWNHFWAHLPFSIAATDALIKGCRSKGVRETICTLWGDDGMQVDPFSALPGLAYYAELSYTDEVNPAAIRTQTLGATGEDIYDDYLRASDIDLLTTPAHMKELPDNTSTWLLWEDPLLGLMQPQIPNKKLPAHHQQLAADLAKRATKKNAGPLTKRLAFPAQIAKVLSLKTNLHPNLAAALKKNNKPALKKILKTQLDPLRKELDKLWKIHRDLWLATYRPFGLEVLESRYGTLRTRLETLSDRLKSHLAGQPDPFPEFRTTLHKIFPEDDIYSMIHHRHAATPSIER